MQDVLRLFNPDPEHPDAQAAEIREICQKINTLLNQVIGGTVTIQTIDPDIQPLLLPNTTLLMKAEGTSIDTPVEHQGNGLQRTLIITLLQVLTAVECADAAEDAIRPVIFMIEEPELYLHPQMERKMRDALHALASEKATQVLCCSHSPVFLDMGQRHQCIVRLVKENGRVRFNQVLTDLFDGTDAESQKERLKFLSEFHPGVNEVFFAQRVVLLEERTAAVAFEHAAEHTGVFTRFPLAQRDVTLVDCDGKQNMPLFQKVLNHFRIPYLAIYDEDVGNADAAATNPLIDGLAALGSLKNRTYRIQPTNFEALLGYTAKNNKPYKAIKKINELIAANTLPAQFIEALNQVYFGQNADP